MSYLDDKIMHPLFKKRMRYYNDNLTVSWFLLAILSFTLWCIGVALFPVVITINAMANELNGRKRLRKKRKRERLLEQQKVAAKERRIKQQDGQLSFTNKAKGWLSFAKKG